MDQAFLKYPVKTFNELRYGKRRFDFAERYSNPIPPYQKDPVIRLVGALPGQTSLTLA